MITLAEVGEDGMVVALGMVGGCLGGAGLACLRRWFEVRVKSEVWLVIVI